MLRKNCWQMGKFKIGRQRKSLRGFFRAYMGWAFTKNLKKNWTHSFLHKKCFQTPFYLARLIEPKSQEFIANDVLHYTEWAHNDSWSRRSLISLVKLSLPCMFQKAEREFFFLDMIEIWRLLYYNCFLLSN